MLRKLKEHDLSQVALIEQATQALPWSDKIFKDCFSAGYPGWVLEREERVIAFALLSIHHEEGHLLNVAVHPHFQRRGFGTQILTHTLKMAQQGGAMLIYLEVRESNTRAIALYTKMNFVQIGTRNDYYPAFEGRENGLIYARELKQL